MSPNISIAMATYNGAKYIQEQLDSFAKQHYQPFELVVCDDGSTDETLQIIGEFAATSSFPVRIYRNETNLGFANNFMKCASLCKGDWIAFSDQDDVWFPEKFSKVVNLIEQRQSDKLVVVCHSADLVNEDLTPTGQRTPNFQRDEIKGINEHSGFLCIAGFTITFKAELLAEIDSSLRPGDYFAPEQKWQSHDKWIAMLANALGEVAYISESLALYRRHAGAFTGSHKNPSAINRVRKSSLVGSEFYKFQSDAAKECANSFRKICESMSNDEKKKNLLIAASKYDALSEICGLRARLYGLKNPFAKLRMMFVMSIKRGYWGSHFYALGTFSFFKDIAFGLGFLNNESK